VRSPCWTHVGRWLAAVPRRVLTLLPRPGLCCTGLARDGAPGRLDPWLRRARDSAIQQLQSFAKHLQDDYAAVRAGVALAWNDGRPRGRSTGLKRSSTRWHGRANLDLLERRFLLAA